MLYLTRYATTRGIIAYKKEEYKLTADGEYYYGANNRCVYFKRDEEIFEDKEKAFVDARNRIVKAITATQRKLRKLESTLLLYGDLI